MLKMTMNENEVKTLFENENWLVVDKPAGWLTVPGRNAEETPVLGHVLEKTKGMVLWPCHRLDREVSGLVLFAKKPEAHRLANGWFENHKIQKIYEAWTRYSSEKSIELDKKQIWKLTASVN